MSNYRDKAYENHKKAMAKRGIKLPTPKKTTTETAQQKTAMPQTKTAPAKMPTPQKPVAQKTPAPVKLTKITAPSQATQSKYTTDSLYKKAVPLNLPMPEKKEEKPTLQPYNYYRFTPEEKERQKKDFEALQAQPKYELSMIPKDLALGAENVAHGLMTTTEGLGKTILGLPLYVLGNFSKLNDMPGDWIADKLGLPEDTKPRPGDYMLDAAKAIFSVDGSGKYAADIDRRYNTTDLQKTTGKVISATSAMLPNMALAVLTAGATAAPQLASAAAPQIATGAATQMAVSPGLIATGLSAGGNAASEAYRESGDLDKAVTYGALSGLSEVAIEKMFAGIPELMGGGTASEAIQGLTEKLMKNQTTKNAVDTIVDVLGEGAEEAIQTMIEPALQRMTYDPDASWATKEEMLESAINGALVSGILKLGTDGIGSVDTRVSEAMAGRRGSVQTAQVKPAVYAQQAQNPAAQQNQAPFVLPVANQSETVTPNPYADILAQADRATVEMNQQTRRQNAAQATDAVQIQTETPPQQQIGTTSSKQDKFINRSMNTAINAIAQDQAMTKETRETLKTTMRNFVYAVSQEGVSVDAATQALQDSMARIGVTPSSDAAFDAMTDAIASLSKDAQIYYRYVDAQTQAQATQATRATQQAQEVADETRAKNGADVPRLKDAHRAWRQASENASKVVENVLLTPLDEVQIDRMLKGEITPDFIAPSANKEAVMAVFEAKKAAQEARKPITEYKTARQAELFAKMEKIIENSDTWKDKKMGFSYATESTFRNFRDTIPEGEGQALALKMVEQVSKNEATKTRYINQLHDNVREMKLSKKESQAVQYIGERATAAAALQEDKARRGYLTENKQLELDTALQEMAEYRALNPELDYEKVQRSVSEFRQMYDSIFETINDALIETGNDPIPYRRGYFPHFQADSPDTVLGRTMEALGFSFENNDIPTNLAGRTAGFKPTKSWNPHAQQRTGTKTTYDAVDGFERYLRYASDVIFHTEDIQNFRTLERALREKYSSEGTKEEIKRIRENEILTEEQKEKALEEAYSREMTRLNAFVPWLSDYTNILANKKSMYDRGMETGLGRGVYGIAKRIESRVAANMVGMNIASAMTNFIPLAQGGAEVSTKGMMRGMFDTAWNFRGKDGFTDSSDFLTNRQGTGRLNRTTVDRLSDAASKPMEIIDTFTAQTLVRARYYDNIDSGMSESAAMSEANTWAGNIMADRSKGAAPTIYSSTNPAIKAVTMFQVEVKNQLSHIYKDLPREAKEKGIGWLTKTIVKYLLGQFIFNDLYEKIAGRRPALDPLGVANEAVGDFTGYQLPNIADTVGNIASGRPVDFTTTKQSAGTALATLGENVVQELPFVGGLAGGGRLPISSAIPFLENPQALANVANSMTGETPWSVTAQSVGTELLKPAAYLLPPFGGGQVQKTAKGLNAMANEGSYKLNSKGEEILQYPLHDQGAADYAQAALFGKWANPNARAYIEGEIKALNAKETSAYKDLMNTGATGGNAYSAVADLKGVKKTEDETSTEIKRRMLLENENITANQKRDLDKALISSGNDKIPNYESGAKLAISLMDESGQRKARQAALKGVTPEAFVAATEGLKDKEGAANKAKWLLKADLSTKDKQTLSKLLVSEKDLNYTGTEEALELSFLSAAQRKEYGAYKRAVPTGVTPEVYAQAQAAAKKTRGEETLATKEAIYKAVLQSSRARGAQAEQIAQYLYSNGQGEHMERYEKFKNAYAPGFTESDYSKVYAAAKGGTKEEKMAKLLKQGYNQREALILYDAMFADKPGEMFEYTSSQFSKARSAFGEEMTQDLFERIYESTVLLPTKAARIEGLQNIGFDKRGANAFYDAVYKSSAKNPHTGFTSAQYQAARKALGGGISYDDFGRIHAQVYAIDPVLQTAALSGMGFSPEQVRRLMEIING